MEEAEERDQRKYRVKPWARDILGHGQEKQKREVGKKGCFRENRDKWHLCIRLKTE